MYNLDIKKLMEKIETLENPYSFRWQAEEFDIYESAKEASADVIRAYLEYVRCSNTTNQN